MESDEVQTLREEVVYISHFMETQNQRSQNIISTLQNDSSKYQSTITELEDKNTLLEQQLDSVKAIVRDAEKVHGDTITSLKLQISEIQRQAQETESSLMDALKQKSDALIDIRTEIDAKNDQIAAYATQKSSLSSHDESQELIDSLTSDKTKLAEIMRANEADHAQIRLQLESRLKEAELLNSSLKSELDQVILLNKSDMDTIESLRNTLSKSQTQFDLLSNESVEKITQLRDQVAQLVSENSTISADSKLAKTSYETEIESLRAAIEEFKNHVEIAMAQEHKNEYENDKEILKTEMEIKENRKKWVESLDKTLNMDLFRWKK